MRLREIPTKEEISIIHEKITPFIHRTPILSSQVVNQISGCTILFKCENFQKMGAFKMRGASSAAAGLSEAEKLKGLATHSSGNHAQAVALTAKNLGAKSFIVMPENAPQIKKQATEGYGAKVITCKSTLASREATLEQVVRETGATFIHPYNNYNVIAGQATAFKEMCEDLEPLDYILGPIGGGGLVSGTALTAKYWSPQTKVIGVEPKTVDDAYRSLREGRIVVNKTTATIADGLRTNLSEITFEIIHRFIDQILTVREETIVEAMKLIWERMKIIIEPSSAVPVAAVLENRGLFNNRKVGIILTGGNVDLTNLPW